MRKVIILVLACVFAVSGVLFIRNELSKKNDRDFYNSLQESMENSMADFMETTGVETEAAVKEEPDTTEPELPAYEAPEYLSQLMAKNNRVVGWLMIDGTNVNYPIVQDKEDNEYFLHRDINGKENTAGSIYLDSNHDINENGLHTVYGHHMKDGSMFKDVSKFVDPDYMDEHKDITVYTGEKSITLEVVYCYAAPADGEYRSVIGSAEDLEAFLLEKTGEEIKADNVFVFVTCEYTHNDGRTFLIAVPKR